jgi:hypothetical protein
MSTAGWVVFCIVIAAIALVCGTALNWSIWTYRDYRLRKKSQEAWKTMSSSKGTNSLGTCPLCGEEACIYHHAVDGRWCYEHCMECGYTKEVEHEIRTN